MGYDRRRRFQKRMRTLRWTVLMGSIAVVVMSMVYRLADHTSGSVAVLEELPDLFSRIKTPIVWTVPDGGVRYERFFHGYPETGHKFVLLRVQMEARIKIGYPVVPKCFQLVDADGVHYYPRTRSPLFIHLGDEFRLDRGDTIDDELLFEIPEGSSADRLTFERYREVTEESPQDAHTG
jgi:hypothetical protein